MKLGIVLKVFPVLSESFILRQIESLAERETIKITILADQYNDDLLRKLSPTLASRIEKDEVKVVFNRKSNKKVFFDNNVGYSLKSILPHPFFMFKKIVFDKVNFSNAIYSGFIRKLLKKNRENIDIFHFHFLTTYLSFLFLGLKIPQKIIVSVRGYDCTRLSSLNKYEVEMIKDSIYLENTTFLPVSESLKNILIYKGISKNLTVNYSGIDTRNKVFEFNDFSVSNSSAIKFIQVGRLVEKKGFGDSLLALSKLQNKYVFEFHIVGSGPKNSIYKEQVKSLGLEKQVIFHGALLHNQTLSLIKEADCLLVPSKTAENGDMEGIPNVIKEAMLLNTLVVASTHSGIPEVVVEGETGFLHDEGSISSQVMAIDRLLENRKNWPNISSKAKRNIQENFDIRVTVDELMRLYS